MQDILAEVTTNGDPTVVYLLMTGIGVVTSALVYVAKIVHADCANCKEERAKLRQENTMLTLLIAHHFGKSVDELKKEGQKLLNQYEAKQ